MHIRDTNCDIDTLFSSFLASRRTVSSTLHPFMVGMCSAVPASATGRFLPWYSWSRLGYHSTPHHIKSPHLTSPPDDRSRHAFAARRSSYYGAVHTITGLSVAMPACQTRPDFVAVRIIHWGYFRRGGYYIIGGVCITHEWGRGFFPGG